MSTIQFNPIGVIRTPHRRIYNMPIQPIAAEGIKGYIEIFPEFVPGLKDLESFSHITLLYHFHKIEGYMLQVVPFMDSVERGIFACKAPIRPNPIGISTVTLRGIDGNRITIEEVDMLDRTPLLDIKPFYPKYDNRDNVIAGWLEQRNHIPVDCMVSDNRFKN